MLVLVFGRLPRELTLELSLSVAFGGLLAGALLKGGLIGSGGIWHQDSPVKGIMQCEVCGDFLSVFLMTNSPSNVWFLSAKKTELGVQWVASDSRAHWRAQLGHVIAKGHQEGFFSLQTYLCCLAALPMAD